MNVFWQAKRTSKVDCDKSNSVFFGMKMLSLVVTNIGF